MSSGIAITHGVDVDGVKVLYVNVKCHSISFVSWTYDPAKVQALAAITPGNKMNANNENKKNECKKCK